MKKWNLYISLIAALILTIYYGSHLFRIRNISKKSDFRFNIPKIKPIVVSMPNMSHLSNPYVWNVKVEARKTGMGGLENVSPKGKTTKRNIDFKLKRINGIPTLYNVYNQKYKWELFGIVGTEEGEGAIFYNPFLKKDNLRLITKGARLDKYLVVKDIKDDNITVELIVGNKTREFLISMFEPNPNKVQKGANNK